MIEILNKHPEILTGLFTMLGVIIGWGLQFVASCIKNRSDKIAEIKKTVFLALTLWDILIRSRIDEFTNTYIQLLIKKYPNISKKQQSKFYNTFIQTLLWNFLDEGNLSKIEDISSTFQSTINYLSGFDPIAAYKIHGSKEMFRLSVKYRDIAFDLRGKFINKLDEDRVFEYDENIFKNSAKIVNEALSEIEKMIFEFTFRYDIFHFISIKKMLKEQKIKFDKKLKDGFDINIANTTIHDSPESKVDNNTIASE